MGVLEFFGTLSKHSITSSGIIENLDKKIISTHFLVDFNAVIHNTHPPITTAINEVFASFLESSYKNQYLHYDKLRQIAELYSFEDYYDSIVKNSKITKTEIIDMTKKYFTQEKMDKIILKQVIKNFSDVLKKYLVNDKLEEIFIAIDGTPSKAKMIEQRQRRFAGAVLSEIKKKIFSKYKNELQMMNNFIYDYYENMISWNRALISPGTEFMEKVSGAFKSTELFNYLKKTHINLKKIIVSDMYEIGEGEKKIVNYLKKNNQENKSYIFFGADADLILLTLLLNKNNVDILRDNQQSGNMDLIRVGIIRENIFYYIEQILKNKGIKKNINSHQIISDIVCISSIFGNDFIHKLDSISVKYQFKKILDIYIEVLIKDNETLCIIETDKKYKLNSSFLYKIFVLLEKEENDFIVNNKMYQKYINFFQIKEAFPYENFTDENIFQIVTKFKIEYNEFCMAIRNKKNIDSYLDNKNFIYTVRNLATFNMSNLDYLTDELYINFFVNQKEFPKISLSPKIVKKTVQDFWHKNKIQGKNNYEIECYKLENMLDEYTEKMNATPLELTGSNIDTFYLKYFHVKKYEVFSSEKNEEIKKIIEKYLEALYWIFDYYYNSENYINPWCYEYEKSPLIRDIVKYFSFSKEIIQNINKYNEIKIENYFNTIEQLIYISPPSQFFISILPEEYREIYSDIINDKKYEDFFIDVKKIANDFWSIGKEFHDYGPFDCHGASFFQKCILKKIKRQNEQFDKKLINDIRNRVKIINKSTKRKIKSIKPIF